MAMDPLLGSPTFMRAVAAGHAELPCPGSARRARAAGRRGTRAGHRTPAPAPKQRRLREWERWAAPINIRAATQGTCLDGGRLDLGEVRLDFDGMDTSYCEGELYWDHRDGIVDRRTEVIGRVIQLREARRGREFADLSLIATVRLDLSTERGHEQWQRHQARQPLAASILYRVKERPTYPSTWVRQWELVNVSLIEPGEQADKRAVTPGWML